MFSARLTESPMRTRAHTHTALSSAGLERRRRREREILAAIVRIISPIASSLSAVTAAPERYYTQD